MEHVAENTTDRLRVLTRVREVAFGLSVGVYCCRSHPRRIKAGSLWFVFRVFETGQKHERADVGDVHFGALGKSKVQQRHTFLPTDSARNFKPKTPKVHEKTGAKRGTSRHQGSDVLHIDM